MCHNLGSFSMTYLGAALSRGGDHKVEVAKVLELPEADVVTRGELEAGVVLEDDGDLATQVVGVVLAEIDRLPDRRRRRVDRTGAQELTMVACPAPFARTSATSLSARMEEADAAQHVGWATAAGTVPSISPAPVPLAARRRDAHHTHGRRDQLAAGTNIGGGREGITEGDVAKLDSFFDGSRRFEAAWAGDDLRLEVQEGE